MVFVVKHRWHFHSQVGAWILQTVQLCVWKEIHRHRGISGRRRKVAFSGINLPTMIQDLYCDLLVHRPMWLNLVRQDSLNYQRMWDGHATIHLDGREFSRASNTANGRPTSTTEWCHSVHCLLEQNWNCEKRAICMVGQVASGTSSPETRGKVTLCSNLLCCLYARAATVALEVFPIQFCTEWDFNFYKDIVKPFNQSHMNAIGLIVYGASRAQKTQPHHLITDHYAMLAK